LGLEKINIQFTVLGNGHIGKRHTQIIQSLGYPVYVLGSAQETRDWFESQQKKGLQSADDLHVVTVIATPNYLHVSQAIQAIQLGSHVLIEKPMGLTAASCRQVITAANKHNRLVFCVMQNRFSPPGKWLKDMVDSGRLGKIYQVQVNCFWNRSESYYRESSWKGQLLKDGGTLFTQFSHFIDTLFWLFGEIETNTAKFYNHNHPYIEFEDSGMVLAKGFSKFDKRQIPSVSMQFPIQINYSTSCYGQNLESSITVLAEHGTIKVGGQYMEKVLACAVKDYQMPDLPETLPPNDYGTYKGSAGNHAYVYRNILEVLANKAKIACTAEEGLKVVAFIEEVYKMRMV
jgi:predicted dehydrogenase